jgi:phosphocarrier protein NPr
MKLQKELTIVNKLGLHARAATKLVRLAHSYDCEIVIQQGEQRAPANSVLALLMLESGQGKRVTLICDGDDAEEAIENIAQLIANKFDESQ